MQANQLPISLHKESILRALADHQVIVVESPTGSGKTTQIPQILLKAGYAELGLIGITQPRRIAAVSVAEFIARQQNTRIPERVGYKMRFEDRTSEATRIKIMTDGILLQEMKADPWLSRYSLLMVDEAHERSLNIDFILGLLKQVLEQRPGFKVIVSSATINAELFSTYFDECPVVKIDAPSFPVEVFYQPMREEHSPDEIIEKISAIVDKERRRGGDILIFLPGEAAIKSCIAALQALPGARKLEILPLYSRLSAEEQEKVFAEVPGKTKVVVATNIAETSVTIDGVRCVIDPGWAKLNFYNPRNYTASLIEVPVSRASSNQRKGRAGRTRPGVCHRLYSPEDFRKRPLFTREEILRTDLSEVVLRMAELGIRDFEQFDFLSPPGKDGIVSAIETLKILDALDEKRELTALGRRMIAFPLLPRLSRIIVEAMERYPGVLEEVLIGVSFLSARSPFLLPAGEEMAARKAHHGFQDPQGDFVSYLKMFKAFVASGNKEAFCAGSYLDARTMHEIRNIKVQLEEIVSEMGFSPDSGGPMEDYLCAISRGLIQFVCVQSARGTYASLTAGRILIHPGSVMFRENPRFIVAGEIVRTSRMYARSVSPLKKEWLKRISPLIYRSLVTEMGKPPAGKKKREFTDTIKIGSEIFRLGAGKGNQKVALLPWEKVRGLMERTDRTLLPDYGKLRGVILYRNYEILNGERLKTILYLVPRLSLDKGILSRVPATAVDLPAGSSRRLPELLKQMLKPCRLKKKSRRLGFTALITDNMGKYRLTPARNFSRALAVSMSSLEALADEPEGTLSPLLAEQIGRHYRKLSAILEEL
jgi:ATP-dependent helicase HrpA